MVKCPYNVVAFEQYVGYCGKGKTPQGGFKSGK
jgi:hypothetical protein